MRDTIIIHSLHKRKLRLMAIKELDHGQPAST